MSRQRQTASRIRRLKKHTMNASRSYRPALSIVALVIAWLCGVASWAGEPVRVANLPSALNKKPVAIANSAATPDATKPETYPVLRQWLRNSKNFSGQAQPQVLTAHPSTTPEPNALPQLQSQVSAAVRKKCR